MQTIERSALVGFSPAQMYALVNDVARYPEFLPWCTEARVAEESAGARTATLKVARGVMQTEFTTRNTSSPDEQIHMQLLDGPFRELAGLWRFEPIGPADALRGSKVRFRVDFEFKNRLTAIVFNSVFESLCGTLVDAFVQRAQRIYGRT